MKCHYCTDNIDPKNQFYAGRKHTYYDKLSCLVKSEGGHQDYVTIPPNKREGLNETS